MTPAHLALFRGLAMAAHACGFLARQARESGQTAEYLNHSRHAAWLAEDARIARGDSEALQDRTERMLEQEWLAEREMDRELQRQRSELEKQAMECVMEALQVRRARV